VIFFLTWFMYIEIVLHHAVLSLSFQAAQTHDKPDDLCVTVVKTSLMQIKL